MTCIEFHPLPYRRTSELRRCYPRDPLVRSSYPTRSARIIPHRVSSRLTDPAKSRCSHRWLVALRPFRRHSYAEEYLDLNDAVRACVRFLLGPRGLRIQSGERSQERVEEHTPFRKIENGDQNNTWYILVTLRDTLPSEPLLPRQGFLDAPLSSTIAGLTGSAPQLLK